MKEKITQQTSSSPLDGRAADNAAHVCLPQELQKQMLKFFLKTSIPRIKQKKINALSESKTRAEASLALPPSSLLAESNGSDND